MEIKVSNKKIWVENPVLKRRKRLCVPERGFSEEQLDYIVKFCFYLCDKASPLWEELNFAERKEGAISLAKIKKGDVLEACRGVGNFMADRKINKWVSSVMTEYLKLRSPTLFETWISMKINFHQTAELLRIPLGTDKDLNYENSAVRRQSLQSAMYASAKEIMEIEEKLFPLDELREVVEEVVNDEALASFAEMNAEDME